MQPRTSYGILREHKTIPLLKAPRFRLEKAKLSDYLDFGNVYLSARNYSPTLRKMPEVMKADLSSEKLRRAFANENKHLLLPIYTNDLKFQNDTKLGYHKVIDTHNNDKCAGFAGLIVRELNDNQQILNGDLCIFLIDGEYTNQGIGRDVMGTYCRKLLLPEWQANAFDKNAEVYTHTLTDNARSLAVQKSTLVSSAAIRSEEHDSVKTNIIPINKLCAQQYAIAKLDNAKDAAKSLGALLWDACRRGLADAAVAQCNIQ